MEVKGLIELSNLTSVCSKGWAPSGRPLGAFLKQIPELSKKPGITVHRSVFLDSVCILSQHSRIVSIEVREVLPILPVCVWNVFLRNNTVFSSAFSANYAFQVYNTETGPCFKAGQWVQTTVLNLILLLLGLFDQLLPVIACLWLSVRLHVCFSSLQRLRCIPKPIANLRDLSIAPRSLLGAVSLLTH